MSYAAAQCVVDTKLDYQPHTLHRQPCRCQAGPSLCTAVPVVYREVDTCGAGRTFWDMNWACFVVQGLGNGGVKSGQKRIGMRPRRSIPCTLMRPQSRLWRGGCGKVGRWMNVLSPSFHMRISRTKSKRCGPCHPGFPSRADVRVAGNCCHCVSWADFQCLK
jgi:hypothetical protein